MGTTAIGISFFEEVLVRVYKKGRDDQFKQDVEVTQRELPKIIKEQLDQCQMRANKAIDKEG